MKFFSKNFKEIFREKKLYLEASKSTLQPPRDFWPLTASMTSEVRNNYAYYIPQDICNKFIEIKIFVGCMVSRPN